MPPKLTQADIFARVVITPTCWLWSGALTGRGYGKFGSPARSAHRYMYELFRGPIPDELEIDHLCRVHRCVNPDHLEAVPHKVNVERGELRLVLGSRTHCKNGHEFTPENTRTYVGGRGFQRVCRACKRESMREYRAARRA